MTTTTAHRDILAAIADTRRVIDQARTEGAIERGELNSWREDALARAGDYAVAGRMVESRRMAELARS